MTTLIRKTTWFMAGGLTALHFWITWRSIGNALATADKLDTVSIYTVVGVILFVGVVLQVCIVAGAVTVVRLSEAYYAMPKSHGGKEYMKNKEMAWWEELLCWLGFHKLGDPAPGRCLHCNRCWRDVYVGH